MYRSMYSKADLRTNLCFLVAGVLLLLSTCSPAIGQSGFIYEPPEIPLSKNYYHPDNLVFLNQFEIVPMRIDRLKDGDTFEVTIFDFGEEIHDEFRPSVGDTWEHRGKEKTLGFYATEKTGEIIPAGCFVYAAVELDENGEWKRDWFKRILGHIWLQEYRMTLSQLQIKLGYALPYRPKGKKQREVLIPRYMKMFGLN